MNYIPELGVMGNIKNLLSELNHTNGNILNETDYRRTADTENREAVEQFLTDLYLDNVQAQQDITELQLQQLGG